jgi:hypothetical protein
MERHKKMLVISKRLLIFAAISLLVTAIFFGLTYYFNNRFMMSWFAFQCGIIGGFVSIQQRLKNIDDNELTLLSESWATILVIPIYGGIFSLILYLLFLSGLVKGHLFPNFYMPEFSLPPTTENIREFFNSTYPMSGADFAKFAFWSFVAGFSERFVPQIISKVTSEDKPEQQ